MPLTIDEVLAAIECGAPRGLVLPSGASFQSTALDKAEEILARINATAANLEGGDKDLAAVKVLLRPAAACAGHKLLARMDNRVDPDGKRPACPMPPWLDAEFIADVERFIESNVTRLCEPT